MLGINLDINYLVYLLRFIGGYMVTMVVMVALVVIAGWLDARISW
jgi:hypothetical protein